ncbi:MAG: BCD family MFS transporter [Hyphomicrobium sp.]|nr:BCD family MFS transporter [Hyphomicrobium sp.]
MKTWNDRLALQWARLSPAMLPFADVATAELPLGRLLRLSLFQVSVAIAVVLLNGTLNRVMIVELGMSSSVVALMVSLPLLFAPFRALIGHRSDTHRTALGWRRAPFIWIGSLLQFGGLAIMPFALILLSGDTIGPSWIGATGAALAFLLVGVGMHTTQTAGLALATDIAAAESRPRVVAFLYVMLLVGTVVGSLLFGALLADFSQLRLIQVIQGSAVVTVVLNVIALWKQEARRPTHDRADVDPDFYTMWHTFADAPGARRTLVAIGLGTAAFSMQDILLEPYGGEVLHFTVGETTALTGMLAAGTLAGFAVAASQLSRGIDTYRIAASGALAGLIAFPSVMLSGPIESAALFRIGTILIGFGGGLFSVGSLTAAMEIAAKGANGMALGAWGAVQATAAGLAIASSGAIRDGITKLAGAGALGPAFQSPASGYNVVYLIEIILLFATLAVAGPLVGRSRLAGRQLSSRFGIAEFPG